MSSTLHKELHALLTQPGPAALGPEARPGTLAQADLNRTLDELFRRHGSPATDAPHPLLRALQQAETEAALDYFLT